MCILLYIIFVNIKYMYVMYMASSSSKTGGVRGGVSCGASAIASS